jgi:hypothetical protein
MRGLVGAWRLQSAQFELSDSGERIDLYGAAPSGRLVLTADGQMSAILTRADRAAADGADRLYASMMAYSGVYRLEGAAFITTVDVAWAPAWLETEQIRFFELAGDRLSLVSPEQDHPLFPGRLGRGRLAWRREAG